MKSRTNTRQIIRRILIYLLLIAVSVAVIFPLYYAVVISVVADNDVSQYPPPVFPTSFQPVENFRRAFEMAPLLRYLGNSVVQSSLVTLSHLVLGSLAAYAFAFIPFRGKQIVFLIFLSTMMIPWEATLIPNYLTIGRLHWKDTFQGLAAPFMATAFGTFLLRQFFLSIPKDLQDAATIDGCGHLRFLIDDCRAAGSTGARHAGGL